MDFLSTSFKYHNNSYQLGAFGKIESICGVLNKEIRNQNNCKSRKTLKH